MNAPGEREKKVKKGDKVMKRLKGGQGNEKRGTRKRGEIESKGKEMGMKRARKTIIQTQTARLKGGKDRYGGREERREEEKERVGVRQGMRLRGVEGSRV